MTRTNHLFVAINYKTSHEVAQLVDSLLSQNEHNWQLIIKDNSEDAGETARLKKISESSDKVSLHESNENVGYFPGAMSALESIDALQYATITISNVDLSLGTPDFTANLDALETLPAEVMVVAPDLFAVNKRVRQNPFMVSRPRFSTTVRRRIMFNDRITTKLALKGFRTKVKLREFSRRFGRPIEDFAKQQEASEIYAPHGAFIIFRRSFFAAGNAVEHPLPLFAEELTVAEQVRSSAGKVIFWPSLTVLHRENASMGGKKSNYILDSLVASGRYGYSLYSKSNSRG